MNTSTIILVGTATLIVIVATTIWCWVLRKKWLAKQTTPTPSGTPTPSPSKGIGWGVMITLLVVVGLIVWGLTSLATKKSTPPPRPATTSGILVVQPKEEWVFSQVCENGKERTFEVEVTKEEAGLLHIVVQQECGGRKTNMGGLKLTTTASGGWTGTWVNYRDGDHGNVDLRKIIDNVWYGDYKLQDGTTRPCGLKKVRLR